MKENLPLLVKLRFLTSYLFYFIYNIIRINCFSRNIIEVNSKETLEIIMYLIQSKGLLLISDASLLVVQVNFKARVILISNVRVTIHE